MLKGDLGNYVTAIDTTVFRGFSIADNVAPFVVINDQDARSAWSFTLLHETTHLLLGQTGVSAEYSENEVESFCDDVAGDFLLPADALDRLELDDSRNFESVVERVNVFAEESRVSRAMVAYKAYRSQLITQELYRQLKAVFRQQWREERGTQSCTGPRAGKESRLLHGASSQVGGSNIGSGGPHDGGGCSVNFKSGSHTGR